MDISKDEMELQEALVKVRKKKLQKKIISVAIVLGILLLMFIMIFNYGYNAAKNNAQSKIDDAKAERDHWMKMYEDLTNVPVVLDPVTPEIVQKVLASKTNEISELASAEYIFTNAAKYEDTAHIMKFIDWATKKSFVLKWDGKIKAGVKLDNLKVEINDKVITITIPRAEILSYETDQNSVEVLEENNNIFCPISVEDKVNFDKETELAMRQKAVDSGLLEKAQRNAEMVIENLVTASVENVEEYEIKFAIAEK